MKIKLPKEYWNTWGLPPPISYKPDATIGKMLTDKSGSLKVDIKTQRGERYSEMVAINVPLFQTGISEDLLKFIAISKKSLGSRIYPRDPKIFV